jgi:hypothetical protein
MYFIFLGEPAMVAGMNGGIFFIASCTDGSQGLQFDLSKATSDIFPVSSTINV